jgi:hypothetical protein
MALHSGSGNACGTIFGVILQRGLAMTKPPRKGKRKKHTTEVLDMPQMPFNDALRKILSAPPQHRVAKKRAKKK